jgi:hypothetical protein
MLDVGWETAPLRPDLFGYGHSTLATTWWFGLEVGSSPYLQRVQTERKTTEEVV